MKSALHKSRETPHDHDPGLSHDLLVLQCESQERRRLLGVLTGYGGAVLP